MVPHYKYLGTCVDSELNFFRQSNTFYFLTKIKKYLDTDLLLRLYEAYIQSYFEYDDILLENTNY